VDANTLQLVSKWVDSSNRKINVASCNDHQILVGTGGGNLIYIEVHGSELKEVS
jgi:hypothetical protein